MSDSNKILLHVGCANRYYDGFVNCDWTTNINGNENKVDVVFDLGKPWPFADESVDGIVGMHVFQQLHWRELVLCFREAFRVLKKGGVLRIGSPMLENEDKSLDFLLGWNNVNIFTIDLLHRVLLRVGFKNCVQRGFRKSRQPKFARVDNRHDRGTIYVEAVK